jgi:hypothetical protein
MTFLRASLLLLVGLGLADGAGAQSDQSSPQAVITSFFKALKANDEKAVVEILAPKRKKITADAQLWKYWLAVWSRCEVIKFVGAPRSLSSEYDETLRVPVEYKCSHRPNFTNTIAVSRVGKTWYWDEN